MVCNCGSYIPAPLSVKPQSEKKSNHARYLDRENSVLGIGQVDNGQLERSRGALRSQRGGRRGKAGAFGAVERKGSAGLGPRAEAAFPQQTF